MVPQSELNTRLAALQQALDVEGLDAALVVQHADLFYFCGAVNRAILYVPVAGTPLLFALPGSERIREETLFPRIENLSRQEAQESMQAIMTGQASEAQIGGLLTALRIKGETSEGIAGFAAKPAAELT